MMGTKSMFLLFVAGIQIIQGRGLRKTGWKSGGQRQDDGNIKRMLSN